MLVQVKLTLLLAVVAVPINTIFGVTFAILLVRSEFWGKTLVMSMLDLPFSISPVVTGGLKTCRVALSLGSPKTAILGCVCH